MNTTRHKIRIIIIPTLAALVALAILVSLGAWQLARKDWKEGLIRQVEARMNTPAGPLPAKDYWPIMAKPEVEFTRLHASGTFDHSKEVYLYRPLPQGPADQPSGQGWDVITPLMQPDGTAILVNRGFVPDGKRLPSAREATPASADFVGIVRLSEARGLFAATDDAAKKLFFTRDIAAFAKAMGLESSKVAPFMLDAEAVKGASGLPRAGLHALSLPNKHRDYALTWFGLAATLIGVYGVWLFGIVRRRDLAQSKPVV